MKEALLEAGSEVCWGLHMSLPYPGSSLPRKSPWLRLLTRDNLELKIMFPLGNIFHLKFIYTWDSLDATYTNKLIKSLLMSPNAYCHVQKSSPLIPVLRQTNQVHTINTKQTPWLLVRKRTILTDRPPLVGEF
jgi:hypothetical protein